MYDKKERKKNFVTKMTSEILMDSEESGSHFVT